MDAARRWTQAALDDAPNLTPLERDLLLIRLGHSWKDLEPSRGKELFESGLSHFKTDAQADASEANRAQYNFAVQTISTEVRELDR
ncbi:MAG: hypothetical protein JOZ44_05240, partial [Acidobacteria bacterium]|nr:hypothetical protein [Acidobacteriota bacterium]